MKRIYLIAVLVMGPFWAQAEGPAEGDKLNEHKKAILENIDSRITNLNKAKECVNAAQTKDAMKACHQQLRMEQKDLHMKHKMGK